MNIVRDAYEALEGMHWNGQGCGNHDSACSMCYGPSPLSSYEVAEEVFKVVESDLIVWLQQQIGAAVYNGESADRIIALTELMIKFGNGYFRKD